MKDETYAFISDVKDKKVTARSARHTRTHCGKGGRVRLPSDNLSKKELMKMSGEFKSYKLNSPMDWKEFKAMPDDIKVTYIKLIREKFRCPDGKIGEMMGASKDQVSIMFKKLGLNGAKTRSGWAKWDKEGFYAWANGVDKLPTPVPEEEPIEELEHCEPDPVNHHKEPEAFVEDDLPFDIVPVEEPDLVPEEQHIALSTQIDALEKRVDELLKSNEELMAVHEKDKQHIAWLENRVNDLELERHILEKQMEVVQMIFRGQ